MVASSCNAAVRWHHDGVDVLLADESDPNLGRPMRLLKALGMEDLADKLPRTTLAMGDVVGGLTKEAAEDLGLEEGVPVVQGGPDGETIWTRGTLRQVAHNKYAPFINWLRLLHSFLTSIT